MKSAFRHLLHNVGRLLRKREIWDVVSLVLLLCSSYCALTGVLYVEMTKAGAPFGLTARMSRPLQLVLMILATGLISRTFRRGAVTVLAVGVTALLYLSFRIPWLAIPFLSYEHIFLFLTVTWCMFMFWPQTDRGSQEMTFGRALASEAYLVLWPITLALHYAGGVQDFPFSAAAKILLAIEVGAGILILAVIFMAIMRGRLPFRTVIRIVVGGAVGVCIIPMFSAEHGLMDYANNLLLRLVIISLAATLVLLLSIKARLLILIYVCVTFVLEIGMGCFRSVVSGGGGQHPDAHERNFIGCEIPSRHSVYLLIYDGYPNLAVLDCVKIKYGDICEFLSDNGFKLYPDAYSIGSGTIESMRSMLSFDGKSKGSNRAILAGDNVFSDTLKNAGYRTSYMTCGYLLPMRGERMPGDFYFPSPTQAVNPPRIILGCILRGHISQSPNVFDDYTDDDWVAAKARLLAETHPTNEFVYAHQNLPDHLHCNFDLRKTQKEELADFQERIIAANVQIKKDVEALTEGGKLDDAIVIVAGDHGAILLHPEDRVKYPPVVYAADRYGMFLAIHWPKGCASPEGISCLQDVLPEVLLCLTGDVYWKENISDGKTKLITIGNDGGVPDGFVKNGIVQDGPYKGMPLFKAFKDSYRSVGKQELGLDPAGDVK